MDKIENFGVACMIITVIVLVPLFALVAYNGQSSQEEQGTTWYTKNYVDEVSAYYYEKGFKEGKLQRKAVHYHYPTKSQEDRELECQAKSEPHSHYVFDKDGFLKNSFRYFVFDKDGDRINEKTHYICIGEKKQGEQR